MSTRVTVLKLVPGGHGMCRDDDGVFFVTGVAPGEVIEVDVDRKKRGARHARLLRVIEASAERVAPDCVLVDRCGGCDWLHLSTAGQEAGKVELVDDALTRVGRFTSADLARFRRPLVSPPGPEPRRRARFVVDDNGRLSFSARGSHQRIAIAACPALDPRLSLLLPRLPRLRPGQVVRLAVDDDGVKAGLEAGADAAALAGFVDGVVVDGDAAAPDAAVLHGEVTAGLRAATSDALTFAQATRFGGAAIRDAVVDGAGGADLVGVHVLELFAGSGHLSIPLALAGARVTAIEGDPRAFLHLTKNAGEFGAGRVSARRAFIDGALAIGDDVAVLVADPPRTGIPGAASLFHNAAARRVRRLVLVSCDPATGARDLRLAVDAGFSVVSLVPIDAFPRTHHVEWVATLTR